MEVICSNKLGVVEEMGTCMVVVVVKEFDEKVLKERTKIDPG